jgi:hypothetical protein
VSANTRDYLDMQCYRGDHNVTREVWEARYRAHAKHGANSIEGVAADSPAWLSILVEEVGELAHELTYDSGGDRATLRRELIDVAAVVSAWIDALDNAAAAKEAMAL